VNNFARGALPRVPAIVPERYGKLPTAEAAAREFNFPLKRRI
jgi:hypothetical protein